MILHLHGIVCIIILRNKRNSKQGIGSVILFLNFKVIDPDEDERTLEDTLANAHLQIEEKQYAASLEAEGIAPERILKYGFAFQGKRVFIG